MTQQLRKTASMVLLLAALFVLSFFKDHFTPDYLNSENVGFLAPDAAGHISRVAGIGEHLLFWLCALAYSAAFILLPYWIIRLYAGMRLATYIAVGLTMTAVLLYIMVFAGSNTLDHHLVPKLNRYFHSPIITLFLLAACKLNQTNHEKAG